MDFIKPEKIRILNLLSNNTVLEKELKDNNILITRDDYYKNYGTKKSLTSDVDGVVHLLNKDILLKISDVLLNNSNEILERSVQELTDEGFLRNEFLNVLGSSYYLSDKTLAQIFFTYKYSYSECFFEKNAKYFLPQCDLEEIENNEISNSFLNVILKEFDRLSEVLDRFSDFYSYDDIPFEYINYLTHMLGFDQNTFFITQNQEQLFRELSKNILDIYRIKGTEYSYQLLFDFLGLSVELNNYYFDRRMYYKLDGVNSETGTNENDKYLFYLTKRNPLDNCLNGFLTDEAITSKDIGKVEDIFSFEDYLDKIPGPGSRDKKLRVLLGYDSCYEDDFGRTVKYEGPVFTYFKTNYLNLKPRNKYTVANLTLEQTQQVRRLITFLTPIFMKRDTTVEVSKASNEETLGMNWGRDKFFFLDSEDWEDDDFREGFTISPKPGVNLTSKILTKNGFLIDYKNSLGYSSYKYLDETGIERNLEIYKLPLGNRIKTKNTNRYLGDVFKPLNENETDDGKGYPLFVKNKNYTSTLKGKVYDIPLSKYEDENDIQSVLYWPKDRDIIPNSRFETSNSYDFNGDGEYTLKTLLKNSKIRQKIDWVTDLEIKDFLQNNEAFNKTTLDNNKNTYWKKIKTFSEKELDYVVNNFIVINYDYIYNKLIGEETNLNNINLVDGLYSGDTELVNILNNSKDFNNYLVLKKDNNYELYLSTIFDYEQESYNDIFKNNGEYTYNGISKNIYEVVSSERYNVPDDYNKKIPLLNNVNESFYVSKINKGVSLNNKSNHPYIWRPIPINYRLGEAEIEIYKNNAITIKDTYEDLYNCFSNYSNYNNGIYNESLNSTKNQDGKYNLFYVDDEKKIYLMKKTVGNIKYINSERHFTLSNNDSEAIGSYKYIKNVYKEGDELIYEPEATFENRQNHLKRVVYKNRKNGQLIYSTKDCKLYMLFDNGCVVGDNIFGIKEIDFFGKIEKEDDKFYINRFDEDFLNYEEREYKDNDIFYNRNKEIDWKELDVIKEDMSFTTRPTKEITDKIIDNAMNSTGEKQDIVKRLIAYIYSQTASNFSNAKIPESIRKEVWS